MYVIVAAGLMLHRKDEILPYPSRAHHFIPHQHAAVNIQKSYVFRGTERASTAATPHPGD
ncbi:hypothetical protein PO909_024053 [Leuciscus waleckii]